MAELGRIRPITEGRTIGSFPVSHAPDLPFRFRPTPVIARRHPERRRGAEIGRRLCGRQAANMHQGPLFWHRGVPHDSATRRAVSDGARRISIGSRRTLPGIISSLPCEMSRMTWSTSAAGDIFALLTVRVAGVSTSGGSTSTTRMPTPRNCRRSASVKERRPGSRSRSVRA